MVTHERSLSRMKPQERRAMADSEQSLLGKRNERKPELAVDSDLRRLIVFPFPFRLEESVNRFLRIGSIVPRNGQKGKCKISRVCLQKLHSSGRARLRVPPAAP